MSQGMRNETMTFTKAKSACKAIGFTLRKTDYDDYELNLLRTDSRYKAEASYFTDDLQDAVDTATNGVWV